MNDNTDLNENQMDRFAEAATKHNIEKQLKEKYDRILKENQKSKNQKGTILNMTSFIKAAAIVLIVFGCFYLVQEVGVSPSSQAMAQNFLDHTHISGNPDITRKGTRSAKVPSDTDDKTGESLKNQIAREANEAFIAKDYAFAIAKYETLEKENRLLSIDRFYLGISHLRAG